MTAPKEDKKVYIEPYSLAPKEAGAHFGYHPKTIYKLISAGELRYGTHCIKVKGKVLIIVEAFKEWMWSEAGLTYGKH
ncbi:MAG: helix-turn-helix domain-containing protein [Smithella sp.]